MGTSIYCWLFVSEAGRPASYRGRVGICSPSREENVIHIPFVFEGQRLLSLQWNALEIQRLLEMSILVFTTSYNNRRLLNRTTKPSACPTSTLHFLLTSFTLLGCSPHARAATVCMCAESARLHPESRFPQNQVTQHGTIRALTSYWLMRGHDKTPLHHSCIVSVTWLPAWGTTSLLGLCLINVTHCLRAGSLGMKCPLPSYIQKGSTYLSNCQLLGSCVDEF